MLPASILKVSKLCSSFFVLLVAVATALHSASNCPCVRTGSTRTRALNHALVLVLVRSPVVLCSPNRYLFYAAAVSTAVVVAVVVVVVGVAATATVAALATRPSVCSRLWLSPCQLVNYLWRRSCYRAVDVAAPLLLQTSFVRSCSCTIGMQIILLQVQFSMRF